MSRKLSIEALRFFFCIIVCIWHFGAKPNGLLYHGYLAVEFFFILSGYLLYASFLHNPKRSIFEYVYGRIKRFYPRIILALVPLLVLKASEIMNDPYRLVNEILFVRDLGIFGGGVNDPAWYINILVVGGGILFAFLKNNERATVTIILPLIILFYLTYLFGYMKSETVEAWSVHGPISMVLWRGIIEMSIGVLLFHIQHFHPFIGKHSGLIFNCLTILSLVSILAIITMRPFRDKYIYIAVAILIYGCMREDSWLEKICHHALISNLGSLSLDMYLIHISVASVASWAL